MAPARDDDAGRAAATPAADPDAPATRRELERAIRGLALAEQDTREGLLQLAARVVSLVDELTRRLDGVEPRPAPPGTPAEARAGTLEDAVERAAPDALAQIRAADLDASGRLDLAPPDDKYAVQAAAPPCAELLPICEARCCRLTFALSTMDLDEGVLRWDYGHPYRIRQRASDGYCVHNDAGSRACEVHAARPRPCRVFDCRGDARIWLDFDRRILAPERELTRLRHPHAAPGFELHERVRARALALRTERHAVDASAGAGRDDHAVDASAGERGPGGGGAGAGRDDHARDEPRGR